MTPSLPYSNLKRQALDLGEYKGGVNSLGQLCCGKLAILNLVPDATFLGHYCSLGEGHEGEHKAFDNNNLDGTQFRVLFKEINLEEFLCAN